MVTTTLAACSKQRFWITGIQNSTMEESLGVFAEQLRVYSGTPCLVPKDWYEMPWLAKTDSKFMKGFEATGSKGVTTLAT